MASVTLGRTKGGGRRVKKREKSFFEHRGYAAYLASLFFGGGFLRLYRRVWRFLRPTLWLRRLLRLLAGLVLLLESGALFLLLSLAFLLLVPPLVALLLILLPTMLRARDRAAARLLPRLCGKRVVLLRTDRAEFPSWLSSGGYVALRIGSSPSLVRPYRELDGGAAELSPWLWFSLRRRVLSAASRVICIENFQNDLAGRHPRVI